MNHAPLPSHHVEYEVRAGYLSIVADDGATFSAYGAQPRLGERFPAVVLLHDWWGLNTAARLLAVQLAQAGFYVVAPDLFDGKHAATAREAAVLVEEIARKRRFRRVMESFDVLETNLHATRRTAVVGIGMGGGLAFRAAIQYPHREAAVVALSGFPQTYSGQFRNCPVPVLAVYGGADPLIPRPMIDRLRAELNTAVLHDHHRLTIIDGAGHEFFPDDPTDAERMHGSQALAHAVAYLNHHLRPSQAKTLP